MCLNSKTTAAFLFASMLLGSAWADDAQRDGVQASASPGLYRLTVTPAPDRVDWARGHALGALGFGVSLALGERWFAGARLGQPALSSAAPSLPNAEDRTLLLAGYRWRNQQSLSLKWQREGGPELGQRAVQLVYGAPTTDQQTLKLGLSSVTGWASGVARQRVGLSVGYDWPRYFVQLAYDPQVNVHTQDLLRLSAGTRF